MKSLKVHCTGLASGAGGVVGGSNFAGRGGNSRGNNNNNRGKNRNRRPDTGYGAPRVKKSPLTNETDSEEDLIDSNQDNEKEFYDYY